MSAPNRQSSGTGAAHDKTGTHTMCPLSLKAPSRNPFALAFCLHRVFRGEAPKPPKGQMVHWGPTSPPGLAFCAKEESRLASPACTVLYPAHRDAAPPAPYNGRRCFTPECILAYQRKAAPVLRVPLCMYLLSQTSFGTARVPGAGVCLQIGETPESAGPRRFGGLKTHFRQGAFAPLQIRAAFRRRAPL